jgi:hypothetical protein
LTLVAFGVVKGLNQSPAVLKAPRNPWKGTLVNSWVDVIVFGKEGRSGR